MRNWNAVDYFKSISTFMASAPLQNLTETSRALRSELFAPASSLAEANVATQKMQIHPGVSARDLDVQIGRKVFRGLTESDLNCGTKSGAVRESASAGPAREDKASRFLRSVFKFKADANRRYGL